MADINQKIENSLNLAWNITMEELQKSNNLQVGYDEEDETWSVIIKYSETEVLELDKSIKIVNLLNEYAIVTATKEKIEELALYSSVEFIEKPKRIFFEQMVGQITSCVLPLKIEPYKLDGKGVIVGILDSGIDYRNNQFRNKDGTTRLLTLWDQTITGNPPLGYYDGTEYTREEVNQALLWERENSIQMVNPVVPSVDVSGHGTEVSSIAVGTSGVASGADIVVVKLGTPQKNGFPRTTELMQGLDYLVRKALEYKKPLVVNISFGNTYGAHDGNSLIERFIDDMANYWKTTICIGAGNEGNASGHTAGKVLPFQIERVEFAIERREVSLDLQLWKFYEDNIEVVLVAPNGERIGPIGKKLGMQRYRVGETEVLLFYGEPSPYSVKQELFFEFLPINTYIDSGVWTIEMTPVAIITGTYDMWLPSYGVINKGTQFLRSVKEKTLTIPSTAQRGITVGAYDGRTFTYAGFSGRGDEDTPRLVKPDLVAPGVNVTVTTVGGKNKEVSGTSFAAPFVTGIAALLMQWGIIEGNDTYLYGEKLKAYLRKGSRKVVGIEEYPDIRVGYGAICGLDSLENKI